MKPLELDPGIKHAFPGAYAVAQVESTVLKYFYEHRYQAIHVYPIKFSREFIEHVANETNRLASIINTPITIAAIQREKLQVSITTVDDLGELPDGRIYTRSIFIDGVRLSDRLPARPFRLLTPWLVQVLATAGFRPKVHGAIDMAIQKRCKFTLAPRGYLLAPENIIFANSTAHIVDIFAQLSRAQ